MPPVNFKEPGRPPRSAHDLYVRQSPQRGKVFSNGKGSDRRPLDPPPIIQLFIKNQQDPAQNFLQNPYYWMIARLWHETENRPPDNGHHALCGTSCSSLHRLGDIDSNGQSRNGGFFVFGDLSCKIEGKFRLKVILYETLQGEVQYLAEALTNVYEVFNAKRFPGALAPTFLSLSFRDQGVRLYTRKECRRRLKRPASPTTCSRKSQPQSTMKASYGHMGGGGAYTSTIQSQAGYSLQKVSAVQCQKTTNTCPTGYHECGPYGSLADFAQPPTGVAHETSAEQTYETSPMYLGRLPDPSCSIGYYDGSKAAAY